MQHMHCLFHSLCKPLPQPLQLNLHHQYRAVVVAQPACRLKEAVGNSKANMREGKQTAALRPYYKVEEETGNIVKVSHPLSALSSRHLLKSKFLAPAKQLQQPQQSPALLHAMPADATHALLIPLIVQAPPATAAVEPAPPMPSSSGSTTGMPIERGSRQQQSQHERTHCECEEATMTTKLPLPLINDEKVNKNCCERKRALCGKLIRNTDDKISMEHLLKNLIAKNSNNLDASDSIDDNLATNRNRDTQ
uniref:Uncharacterized protein n=1 Tax=Globodera pallida TaxID=36090 RepID=A0A183C9M1_GLOPA